MANGPPNLGELAELALAVDVIHATTAHRAMAGMTADVGAVVPAALALLLRGRHHADASVFTLLDAGFRDNQHELEFIAQAVQPRQQDVVGFNLDFRLQREPSCSALRSSSICLFT